VDLRDFPQKIIEVEDTEALDFVTGLIDPDPTVRELFRPNLPEEFRGVDRGELFEFCVALACALTADTSHPLTSLNRPKSRDDYARLTPDVLARAGRAILSWPSGFHLLADEVRALADLRRGHLGIKKELGPLLAISHDPHVLPSIRQEVRAAADADMRRTAAELPTVRRIENRGRSDLITGHAAAEKYKIRRKLFQRIAADGRISVFRSKNAVKAPILFVDAEIAAIAQVRSDLEAVSSAAVRLGIPNGAMRDLAAKGYIFRENGPAVALMIGDEYYRRSSVDQVIQSIQSHIQPGKPPRTAIRITKAMNRIGLVGERCWAEVFAGILAGHLRIWRVEGRLTALMTSLAVEEIGYIADAVTGTLGEHRGDDIVTRREASGMLGTSEANVISLVHAGLLPKTICRRHVRCFAQEFMFTAEIRCHMAEKGMRVRNRDVRNALAKWDIVPVTVLKHGSKLLWSRAEVEDFLANLRT
jgi:hypothetical protein